MSDYDTVNTFPNAVALVLRTLGSQILREPTRFVSAIRDVYDPDCNTSEMQILARNCDDELLESFNRALETDPVTPDALQAAAANTCRFLTERCMISNSAAEAFSGQLMAGIYQYVRGPENNNDLAPQAVPTPQTPPAPQEPPAPQTPPTPQTPEQRDEPSTPSPAEPPKEQNPDPDSPKPETAFDKVKRFIIRRKIPVIIACVALAACIGTYFFVTKNTVTIRFDGGIAKEGRVEPISGLRGTQVALPENGYTYEGHVFAGWHDTSSPEANPKPLQPGELVTLGESWYFSAVWTTEVTFDGNGADSGQMDPMLADTHSTLIFPKCEYKRKGYIFIGWSEEADGTYGYKAGEEGYINSNTTYYALWSKGALVVEESISKEGKQTNTIDNLDSTNSDIVIMARNDTDKDLRLSLKGSFKSESGNKVQDVSAYSECVAPGETICLANTSYYSDKKAKSLDYTIETDETYSFSKPLNGTAHVKEKAVEDDEIVVNVTNDSKLPAQISQVTMVASTDEGVKFVAMGFSSVEVEPGESAETTIDISYKIPTTSGINVKDLKRTYYVNGYLSDTNW